MRLGTMRARVLVAAVSAVALTTGGLAVSSPVASADEVIAGCTVVANPTPTHFTNCSDRSFQNGNFSGKDLSYANLSGSVFDGGNFDGATLFEADAQSTLFRDASLRGTNFVYANLDGDNGASYTTDFGGSDLTDASFNNATVDYANFTGYGNYARPNLTGVNFEGASLIGSALCFSGPPGCPEFANSNLSSTHLQNALLIGADLSHARLDAANLTGTYLNGDDLSGALLCSIVGFATLHQAHLFEVTLPLPPTIQCQGLDYSGADLTGAHMDHRGFQSVNFTGATMRSADLTGSDLSFATLTGADVTQTLLVPTDQQANTFYDAGGVATWAAPTGLPGATPSGCDHAPGSHFDVGDTTVQCTVTDDQSHTAHGSFTLTMHEVEPQVSGTVSAGSSVITPNNVDANTPLATQVTIPNGGVGGDVTIAETTPTLTPPSGYSLAGVQANITAPAETASHPLSIAFILDLSVLQAAGVNLNNVVVLRNGVKVPPCKVTGGTVADPDPCVSVRAQLTTTAGVIVVNTSHASEWNFARYTAPPPPQCKALTITTTSLPNGSLGHPYSSTLKACGSSLPLQWKKVGALPKGLKLSKAGVISGVPKKATGKFSFSVQVSEVVKASLRHHATRALSITVK